MVINGCFRDGRSATRDLKASQHERHAQTFQKAKSVDYSSKTTPLEHQASRHPSMTITHPGSGVKEPRVKEVEIHPLTS